MNGGLRSVRLADVEASSRRLRDRLDRLGATDVEVVAVTKGFDRSAVDAALACGFDAVGENYTQELLAKLHATEGGARQPTWHMIGRVQRNKVRVLASHVGLWQTVDRVELGSEIARRAPGAAVLVQVNVSGEPQKGGCEPAAAKGLVAALTGAGLDVRGLMAVGPTGPPAVAEVPFRRLVRLADELALPVRSIGMSDDLEVAISAGSTMVRVGRDLFGKRR